MELGAVCDVIRGNGLQKSDFVDSGVPCIHYGQIYTHYGLSAMSTKSFVSLETANKLKKVSYNDVIVATTSENDEDLCKCLVWLGKAECCISGDSLMLKHGQIGKYFVYAMCTNDFNSQKKRLISGTKVRRINSENLRRITIILPPLHKQQQIVDKLDKFDTLTNDTTNGLQKEIELRQKEYEYWREKLLSF